jgi:glycerol kinase
LMQAMLSDYHGELATLRVDGGMSANDWLLQFLSDILNTHVQRPNCIESSALGAAWMAAFGAGLYPSLEDLAQHWSLQQEFSPVMKEGKRKTLLAGWTEAVSRVIH